MQSYSGTIAAFSLDHIGVVVKDIDKTIEFLSSLLGLGPWRIFEDVEYHKDEMKRDELGVGGGEPFRLKMAVAKLGTIVVELLQPLDGRSVYSQFLENKGEGLHHVCFNTSNWDDMVSRLEECGGRIIAGGFAEGRRWAFYETKPGGIIIEPLEGLGLKGESGV